MKDLNEENEMKAERVQFWEQLVAATLSLARRIYDGLDWIEIQARAAKDVFSSRDPQR